MTPFVAQTTEAAALTALRSFIIGVLPAGTPVVQGQINRVAEVNQADFVVFWPTQRTRLSTNYDTFDDVSFTADIAATIMTVTDVAFGTIEVGQSVWSVNVATGTRITGLGSGTGGIGTYVVSPTQTVLSEAMASGLKGMLQPTELNVQVDVHGHNGADNAQVISTLLRDEYGTTAFAALSDTVIPLHADDPAQLPFVNGEQQYEDRWIINVKLQANILIEVPQQFADQLVPTTIPVEATYLVSDPETVELP